MSVELKHVYKVLLSLVSIIRLNTALLFIFIYSVVPLQSDPIDTILGIHISENLQTIHNEMAIFFIM